MLDINDITISVNVVMISINIIMIRVVLLQLIFSTIIKNWITVLP